MNTLENIKSRTSKNFFDTQKPMNLAAIEEIISYARLAPSAFNLQHWRFLAVTDPLQKERLKAVAYQQQKIVDAPVTFIVLTDLEAYRDIETINALSVANGSLPQSVADNWNRLVPNKYADPQTARDEAFRSASLAAMTLILAAEELGFATGPMSGFDAEGVKKTFEISDRYAPVMLIAVGYPAPGNQGEKPRLGLSQVLNFNLNHSYGKSGHQRKK